MCYVYKYFCKYGHIIYQIPPFEKPVTIAYDHMTRTVFWANLGEGEIKKTELGSTSYDATTVKASSPGNDRLHFSRCQ